MNKAGSNLHVIGAGGHARVLADSARRAGFTIAGFVDRPKSGMAEMLLDGAPIVEEDAFLEQIASGPGQYQIALGIGESGRRKSISENYHHAGGERLTFPQIVDPSAILGRGVVIEPGAIVLARTVVNAGTKVGHFAIINTGAIIEHDSDLGRFACVAPGACLGGNVRIGEGAFVGLGAHVTQGVTIGAHAVLGAGALAIRDIPADEVFVGVPAGYLRKRRPWDTVLG